jgi:hypothetical protein
VVLGCIVYFDLLNRKGAMLERLNRDYYDKVLHALAFGALTYSVSRALQHSFARRSPWAVVAVVGIATTGFTVASETLQARTLSGHDEAPHLIANLAGILLATVLAGFGWTAHLRRKASRARALALATLPEQQAADDESPGPTR